MNSTFHRQDKESVRDNNSKAVSALSNIVKTSLGPQGLDKMIVDDIGDLLISNDGATILKNLEITHPAAKCLVELSHLQDQEVGDGTTSVVILAAELISRGNALIQKGLHPTVVMQGMRTAMRDAVKQMHANLCIKQAEIDDTVLNNVCRTSMSSKIVGGDSDFFGEMCVTAMKRVGNMNAKNKMIQPIAAVNIKKQHGASTRESFLVNGQAVQMSTASQQMKKSITNAKIACIDFNLNKFRMALGITVQCEDVSKLAEVRQREMDITKERIQKIIDAGANVILTTKGIDDFAQKFLVEKGVMGLRRIDKNDMRKIAKLTGAELINNIVDEEGDEKQDSSLLGEAKFVQEKMVGDNAFIFIEECFYTKAQTMVLRGANEYMLDEVERSIHDVLCVLKRVMESGSVTIGGGAVEVALCTYLEDRANAQDSKEQMAISEQADALLVIPKTLAHNAALDSTDLVAKLKSAHYKSQTETDKAELRFTGLDLTEGKLRNNKKAGVFEPSISKYKQLKFATEAAITILRIDDYIKVVNTDMQK